MSEQRLITRRDILRKSVLLGVAAAGAGALAAACKDTPKEIHCDDTTGIAPTDVETRKTLAYIDRTPDPNKMCQNCQQFVAPPSATQCGTCKVLKGNVHPNGYCKSWAAKS